MLVLSPEEIAEQLAQLLPTGATVKALTETPALLRLAIIEAKSATEKPEDLAVAAIQVIHQAAADTDSDQNGAASCLLGLADNTKRLSAAKRRQKAAEKAGYNPEHFTKTKVAPTLEATAEALFAIDSAYRLRHQHRIEAERDPTESGLRIDWLRQHRAYRRIWTPLTGVRNDVQLLIHYLSDPRANETNISRQIYATSWYWTLFSVALEQFVNQHGGLWLLADKKSEVEAADALYLVEFYCPIKLIDRSWLRTLLMRSEQQELDEFVNELKNAGERRDVVETAWVEWIKPSLDRNGEPMVNTDLAKWIAAADTYINLIDEDWYKVADYYRDAEVDLNSIDVSKLWANKR